MYSLVIYLYVFVVSLLALFGHKKARLMVQGQRNTWKMLRSSVRKGERYVWFHAASLGEFEQGRPLIEKLRREQPHRKILLTFFSPSGYEVSKKYEGVDIIAYLPFDTPTAARRFVRLVQPEMLILIKYEFWRNYIDVLHRRAIPVYSVSSIFRPRQIFFRWYGRNYARCLRRITHFFVQNEESVRLLSSIGVEHNVSVVGDTRFDRVIDIQQSARALPLVECMTQNAITIVAGSTWQPDETILLDYIDKHPKVRLVLVPHVVSEEHLQQIEQRCAYAIRYSQAQMETIKDCRVLIMDCYGLLSSIYRYATIAYVGGGFGVGIHNITEAAVYGVPVVIGPNYKRFREANDLIALGGCHVIHSLAEGQSVFSSLLNDVDCLTIAGQAAGKYIHQNAGATKQIFQQIFSD